MDRSQAEKLYDSGKEITVKKLLELAAENKALKEKVAQLEKNSQDSSKPPSSDTPDNKPPKARYPQQNNKSTRKVGGQKGHQGKNRPLVAEDEVNEFKHHYASHCKHCNQQLPQDESANTTGDVFRWQLFDIEPIKPYVTEHQAHTTICECGCQTKAIIPGEVLVSNFGENLMGLMSYLTAVLRVSRRGIKEFCLTFLNLSICLGSIQNILEYSSAALEQPVADVKSKLPEQKVINGDETGWYGSWLWIFVTSTFYYFHVAKARGSKVLKETIGDVFEGILCVDRWGAYTKYHNGLIQFCWAHLKRDFLGVINVGTKVKVTEAIIFGKTLERLRKKIMSLWYDFKDGKISRSELINKSEPFINLMKKCFFKHQHSQQRCVRTLSRKLLKHFDYLFVFIYHEGVEPTNNISEQGIRSAVQWRKLCFGNRSDAGAVLTSRLLTATRTCWLYKRSSLEYLGNVIKAYRYGTQIPSLLP
jgi:transposase